MPTVELTEQQVGLLVSAMLEKRMETDRYISGIDAPAKPEERHTCCDFHRLRYQRDSEMLASLTGRQRAEKQLIRLLEEYEK